MMMMMMVMMMMMMILAYMAFCEVSQDQSPGTPAAAGDFGFKVLTASDPAEKTKKLRAELANGRLAMSRSKSYLHLQGGTGQIRPRTCFLQFVSCSG